MSCLIAFLGGVVGTLLVIRGLFKSTSCMITTRLLSKDAPVLLSCSVACEGTTPDQKVEYANELDLDTLEEHLEELNVARDVLQDYIDDIKYGGYTK